MFEIGIENSYKLNDLNLRLNDDINRYIAIEDSLVHFIELFHVIPIVVSASIKFEPNVVNVNEAFGSVARNQLVLAFLRCLESLQHQLDMRLTTEENHVSSLCDLSLKNVHTLYKEVVPLVNVLNRGNGRIIDKFLDTRGLQC